MYMNFLGYHDGLEPNDKFTYIINCISIGLLITFLLFYIFVTKTPLLTIQSLVCLAIFLYVFLLLKHKKFFAAKIFLITGLFIQESSVVFFWFPKETHLNYFYFVVIPIAFFVGNFSIPRERVYMIVTSALATILLILSETIPTVSLISLSDELIKTFNIISTMSTMSSIVVVFYFYGKNLNVIHDKLHILANTDGLTNISNRRVLFEEGGKIFEACQKFNKNFTFIIFDVDFFKKINDQYGHLVGDDILKQMTKILLSNTRKTDILSRYGGEEFALLLKDTKPSSDTDLINDIISTIAAHPFELEDGQVINMTISAGITTYNGQFDSFVSVVQTADKALYQAKEAGRNCLIVLDEAPLTPL